MTKAREDVIVHQDGSESIAVSESVPKTNIRKIALSRANVKSRILSCVIHMMENATVNLDGAAQHAIVLVLSSNTVDRVPSSAIVKITLNARLLMGNVSVLLVSFFHVFIKASKNLC